jgi:hypothetical protein
LEKEQQENYDREKKDFELTHAKIVDKSLFIHETKNSVVLMKKESLITSYEHITIGKDKQGNKIKFIYEWLGDENIKQFNDMDIYPNPLLCPPTTYNLWKPFYMETLKDIPYTPNDEGMKFILNHIKIMCNNKEIIYDYIVKWIAQMFQYPEVKSIAPTLVGAEGTGKSTVIKTLSAMMGKGKVLETKKPSRDVVGEFNELMESAFLVNIGESKLKDNKEGRSEILGLITDPILPINKKGFNKYSINSYHRFIYDSNNLNCTETSRGDRRNIIIYTSSEKKGDVQYFNKINEYIEDINVLRTLYDYFMKIEGMDKFNEIKKPITEHQQELVEMSRTHPDNWLEYYTRQNLTINSIVKTPNELYDEFHKWCQENNIEYETNTLKFGHQLAFLKIDGAITVNTNKRDKTINFVALRKHYGIGCISI